MTHSSDVECEILRLYADGDWREIIQRFGKNKFLPWFWPDDNNLEFIGEKVREENLKSIISVGCGSGLFEWLLSMATGIRVTGLEIDGIFWTTKYSSGIFIPPVLANDFSAGEFGFDTDNSALMFCYFNNLTAFLRYLARYEGTRLIRPGPGRGAYSVPEPFRLPNAVAKDWIFLSHQEMRSSKDFIAVYGRK